MVRIGLANTYRGSNAMSDTAISPGAGSIVGTGLAPAGMNFTLFPEAGSITVESSPLSGFMWTTITQATTTWTTVT